MSEIMTQGQISEVTNKNAIVFDTFYSGIEQYQCIGNGRIKKHEIKYKKHKQSSRCCPAG